MKRYHEAIEWYDKAIQASPKDVDSLGNKAIALYRLGCYKEAIKYFDEVLAINPKDRIALRYKEFVTEEMKKKQFQETTELSQITLERKKGDGHAEKT
jgi:tetratricopeptide (TPR) repeat protein